MANKVSKESVAFIFRIEVYPAGGVSRLLLDVVPTNQSDFTVGVDPGRWRTGVVPPPSRIFGLCVVTKQVNFNSYFV
jgi:hypothetical protein